MHCTDSEAIALASAVVEFAADVAAEVVLCPPFTSLASVGRTVAGSDVALGAQNVHAEASGAFTGEISAGMLRSMECRYVIVGHSERRTLFGETDAGVASKAAAVLAAGMRPIVCIGETLDEREAGTTEAVLERQLRQGVAELGEGLRETVVAYEPVWAIGTGRTASPDQAQSAHAFIRETLAALSSTDVAGAIRIQYGGSVKPANAAELFSLPDVDGGLIGGASLTAESFAAIARATP
jgi:triosephosphate isomerase